MEFLEWVISQLEKRALIQSQRYSFFTLDFNAITKIITPNNKYKKFILIIIKNPIMGYKIALRAPESTLIVLKIVVLFPCGICLLIPLVNIIYLDSPDPIIIKDRRITAGT